MFIAASMEGAAHLRANSCPIKEWFGSGSNSYLPVRENLNNIQLLATPVLNRLFFAGEATSTTDPSTVHGAYLSGIRAAQGLDGDLSDLPPTRRRALGDASTAIRHRHSVARISIGVILPVCVRDDRRPMSE